ncbi:MAG: response regulator [Reichenbachiella sp.]
MSEKISNIILVDDDESTNFLNKIIIRMVYKDIDIEIFDKATEALEYVCHHESQKKTLVFLDLNMPGMNGWDFMHAYQKCQNNKNLVIVVLSSTINPDDVERITTFPEIVDFKSKPLGPEVLVELEGKYFS